MRPAILYVVAAVASLADAQPHAGTDWYARLDRLPVIDTAGKAGLISSYDRTGGNDDGFNGTHSALYVDDNGEHVIFDREGPGVVYTLWCTAARAETPLEWGNLRFYFDNETSPRLDADPNALFAGRVEGFPGWAVYDSYEASGGFVSIVPIPYAERLKITTARRAGFYSVHYRDAEPGIRSWTAAQDLGPIRRAFERADLDRTGDVHLTADLRAEDSAILLERDGPGTVTALRLKPIGRLDRVEARSIRVRAFFDGAAEPSIDAPLDAFFGSGLGLAHVDSLFFEMAPDGWLVNRMPMPFRESARIEIHRTEDVGHRFRASIDVTDSVPSTGPGESLGFLHATHRKEWPIASQGEYLLADLRGTGKVVAAVLTVEPVQPEIKQWWEGDLRVTVDGEPTPSFHGTGHEEDHALGGWSTFWLTNPYTTPVFGLPKTGPLRTIGRQANGPATMYRIWPGGIPFDRSLRYETEHGTQNNRAANYSSLVFSYLARP